MNSPYKNMKLTKEQEEWLALRKSEALKIDPATAKICWQWTLPNDPYCLIEGELSQDSEFDRTYFVQGPDYEMLIWFGDLPASVEKQLRAKHKEAIEHSATIPDIEWLTPDEKDWAVRRIKLARIASN